ncbi:MAG: DUF3592 domain-containing protein [Vulcanimicrobiota bacterium]
MRESFSSLLKNPVVLIFWVLGLLVIAGAVWLLLGLQARKAWPVVAAEVISSEVINAPHGNSLTGQVEALAEDGTVYTITLGWNSSSRGLLEKALAVAPAGERILLSVNPDDQADVRLPVAALDYFMPSMLVVGGLLFIFIPVGVVALSGRKDSLRMAGWSFVMCGVIFLGLAGLTAWQTASILTSWPTVQARIVSSEAVARQTHSTSSRPGGRVHYVIEMVVRYQVEGREMESSLQADEHSSSDRSDLTPLLEGPLGPGQEVTIRHHPDSPRVATLDRPWSLRTFSLSLLAALAGLGTGLMGFLVVKRLS